MPKTARQIHLAALGILRKNSKILAKSRQEVLTKPLFDWYPPSNHAEFVSLPGFLSRASRVEKSASP